MKKQILFKIQQFPHLSETFILTQIIIAIEQGYDVSILVKEVLNFEQSTYSALLKKHDIQQRIILENYNIPKNKFIRVWKAVLILLKNTVSWRKIKNYLELKSKFSLTWIYELAFYYQFENIDIIHIQYGTNVHPIDILKKAGFLNGKIIVSFHGHDASFPINGFIPNNGYYDNLFTGDNLIVANTPYLASKLESLGCSKNNLVTIPVPVDTLYFYPLNWKTQKNGSTKIRILSVGRLEKIKGHEYGIIAVKKLLEKGYDINYTIIGEGSCMNKLSSLILLNNLKKNILLLGAKSHEDIRKEFWNSDLFLMTSTTFNNQIKETQGLVTIEAQACGLPVVAFDSGGIKYTIKDGLTGLLCEEGNIPQFVEAIERLLLDEELRKSFSLNTQSFIMRNYSKKTVSARWEEIYQSLKF